MNRTLNFLACLLAICASGGITVEAQTYGWEQIYAVEENEDYRFESIAFGGDGTLYGIHHYGFAAQPPGSDEWEERCSFYEDCRYLSGGPLTELGADTLFVNTGWSVQRTVDGGLLWEIVYPDGTPFYERIPFFQTNSGMLLIPTGDVIPYSNDRGETWIEAPYPGTGAGSFRQCFDFDQMASGRILVACIGGVAYSDDDGRTWQTSQLWKETYYPYNAADVVVLPNGVAIALADGPAWPDNNIYSSIDGVVWEPRGLILDPEGVDHWPNLLQASTGDVFGVTTYWNRTDVFRMADEGATWTWLDQSLDLPESFRVDSPVMGPDDRIYIVIRYPGPSSGFPPEAGLYRTPDPVAVSVEPGATSPSATPFAVFPNPASDRITIRGANIGEPVVLYDMVGRAVSFTAIPAAIDVSELPSGVYLVRAGNRSRLITIRR